MALQLPWGQALSSDDLAHLPDDGHRYELLEGTLLVTPAPNSPHQSCVLNLGALLNAAAPPNLKTVIAPFDWRVGPSTTFQPDILVACRVDVGVPRLERPPLLAIEVLSRSTRSIDLVLKRDAYATAGVRWYWIVDPDRPSVTVLRLEGDRFVEVAVAKGGEALAIEEPFPVTVVPADLLQ